jgi:hypothetical protein
VVEIAVPVVPVAMVAAVAVVPHAVMAAVAATPVAPVAAWAASADLASKLVSGKKTARSLRCGPFLFWAN